MAARPAASVKLFLLSALVATALLASSMTTTRESQRLATSNARSSRGWAWAALAGAVVLYLGGVPSFGLTVFLSPLTLLLSWAAWRRSPHDGLFWTGLVLNGLLAFWTGGGAYRPRDR